jgi:hypothetical protein
MAEWHKLSERLPEVKQIVLVMADEWLHPRVLRYEVFPFQRLIDRGQGIHFWYPERMQWTRCPMPSDGAKEVPRG